MIHLRVMSIPPSVNNAYFQRGKLRVLTTAGKKYKRETASFLQENYRKEMMLFQKNHQYMLYFRFHLESIQNKNWKDATSKANRYKKFDDGNLCKLLEDCLADAGGIDDSQTITSIWNKRATSGPEMTEIWCWDLDRERDPFDIDFVLEHLR